MPPAGIVLSRLIQKNECEGCTDNCAMCTITPDFMELYPIDLQDGDRMVPNTLNRFIEDNQAAVHSWVAEHCHPKDWEAQIDWMNKNPHVAFYILNYEEMPNPVKIAKIVHIVREMAYGVLIIVGYQGSGKTMTFAWIAEIIHTLKPNRGIYYLGDRILVPDWMKLTRDISEVPNDSILAVDEASIRFSARGYQKKTHQFITDLCTIVRHKRLILIFITQRPELVDINIRRLATAMIIKPVSQLVESSTDRAFMEQLKPFMPVEKEQTLWVDLRTDERWLYFQPLPSAELRALGEAFASYDVTKQESLFGVATTTPQHHKSTRRIVCEHCGYSWDTTSQLMHAGCPSCQRRTRAILATTTTSPPVLDK